MTPALRLVAGLLCAALVAWARADPGWPEQTLVRLSLEEKATQVQMVTLHDEGLVRDLGAGAVLASRANGHGMAAAVNRLQSLAKVPLLVASDFDWSDERHAPAGVTGLPAFMAIGAAGSEALAEHAGRLAALQGRALGLQMMLAPVLDVNTNPDNPIINVRSFGEDPRAVARLGAAYVRGARSAGVLTTAKHFPGHGAVAVDSHRSLPSVFASRAGLDSVELLPYRAAIAAGVEVVMLGHLAVPALDPSGAPATVSKRIIAGVLRGELGFRGLIVTDSMRMRAVADVFEPGEAAVRALEAGADMVLTSPDPKRAAVAIVDAVRSGRLPQPRLDAAVLQVLRAKASVGNLVTAPAVASDFAAMQELAERSITLVRNERRILPLDHGRALFHVTLAPDAATAAQGTLLVDGLRRHAPRAESAVVEPAIGQDERERIIARSRVVETVIVSIFLPISAERGSSAIADELADFVRRLVATGAPVVVVSYSSPYLLRQFPAAPAYLCAYGSSALSRNAATKALFGEIEIRGRLPVSIPGLYPLGHGLMLAAVER